MKIKFILNNNNWTTINKKVEEIKNFFAPRILIDIDVEYSYFKNIPFKTVNVTDGSSGVERLGVSEVVDPDWYNINITSKAVTYDMVLFAISEEDKAGHVTASGIRQDNDEGVIELTIFGGKEDDRVYNHGIDVGNCFAFFCCHEIVHGLFMIQGGEDLTHKYFYSTNPKSVLQYINLNSKTAIFGRLNNFLKQLLGLQNTLKKLPIVDSNREKFYKFAKTKIGQDVSPFDLAPDDLGCVDTINNLYKLCFGSEIKRGIVSTVALYGVLSKDSRFRPITEPLEGDIIISVTGTGNGKIHGHVGVYGPLIMSNDSATGNLKENFTPKSWQDRYSVLGGMKTHYFRIV